MKNIAERWAALRALPPLTTATATVYGCAAVLLIAAAVTWEPGKNPQWLIYTLAGVSVLFFVWILLRGRHFTQTEALVMTAAKVFTIGCLTWTTELTLGALANGSVLPIAGAYAVWFLKPTSGRVVVYLGALWWFAAIVHQPDASLVPFGATLVVQSIIATEVFARLKARMVRLATTDLLTGSLNRRGIDDILAQEMRLAVRTGQPLSVVAIDLDGLRAVNNTQGHTAGDRLLQSAARQWRAGLRRRDSIGRTGGDEFLLVLPCTTMANAEILVRRLATESSGAWSSGVAMAKPGDSVQSILERADSRMYVDKAARARSSVPAERVGPTVHS